MTIALPIPGRFGAGGGEPWRAVLTGRADALVLTHADGSADEVLDAARWARPADAADRSALAGLSGPVLDVGCGPGRMVQAALDAGLPAWGIDSSRAAVTRCRRAGLPVLRRDLWDRLPREGAWGGLLLLDGNVGIGGDIGSVLDRCRSLLRPGGSVVVEAHPDAARDRSGLSVLRDGRGRESAPFAWSQAGPPALLLAARSLRPSLSWSVGGRSFVRFERD